MSSIEGQSENKPIGWFWDKNGSEVLVIPKDGESDEEAKTRVATAHSLPPTVVKPMEKHGKMGHKHDTGRGPVRDDFNPKAVRAAYDKQNDDHEKMMSKDPKPIDKKVGFANILAPGIKGPQG